MNKKYLDHRIQDLKSQIEVKQNRLESIKNKIVDDVWRIKQDLESLEEGIGKLLKEEAIQNQMKNKIIIGIANNHGLPEDLIVKNGLHYNDDSGEIVVKHKI